MIKYIEEHHMKKDNRKFFKDAKEIQKGFVPREVNSKDEMENIISEKDKILQRWIDYFEAILNNHTTENLVYTKAYRGGGGGRRRIKIIAKKYRDGRKN
jgi:hypothetical protein